jgi:hypothetical protein
MLRDVLIAFGRALLSQLHFRMLLLTVLPFGMSLLVWGLALWFGLQPMIDWLQDWMGQNDGFRIAGNVLGSFGLEALKAALVPLLAMWVLLPLMILTALVVVGLLTMPAIGRHVGQRHYPDLEQRKGGSLWGSLWVSLVSFTVFVVLWIVTLPLYAIASLGVIVQPLLWGWLTYRVMAYDALSDYASESERREILRQHRWRLLLIGSIGGMLGAAPTLFWLAGALSFTLSFLLLPLLAAVSIWLYVLVFVFTGLWFEHYCLEALARYRAPVASGAPGLPVASEA